MLIKLLRDLGWATRYVLRKIKRDYNEIKEQVDRYLKETRNKE